MVYNKIFVLAIAAALFATVQTANSAALNNQTVSGVMVEMKKITITIKKLKTDRPLALAGNTNLKKKNKLWTEQIAKRIQPKIDAHNKDEAKIVAKEKAHMDREKSLVAWRGRHDSECNGSFDRPKYERCMGQKRQLDKRINRHNAEKRGLQADRKVQETRTKVLVNEYNSYANLITANLKTIAANEKRHADIGKKIKRLNASLERYRRQLANLCKEADATDDGESKHHCGTMDWDGTSKTLPPLRQILRGNNFFSR